MFALKVSFNTVLGEFGQSVGGALGGGAIGFGRREGGLEDSHLRANLVRQILRRDVGLVGLDERDLAICLLFFKFLFQFPLQAPPGGGAAVRPVIHGGGR